MANVGTHTSSIPFYPIPSVIILSLILPARSSLHGILIPLRMPKSNNKKGNGRGKSASKKVNISAVDADDNLDEILAEVLAGDMQQLPSDGSNLRAITAGSSVSNASPADARSTEVSVSEETINDAVSKGDTAQLKRWGRRGVRVKSVAPLLTAVVTRACNAVLKILVLDLGADVNQANEDDNTPLMSAALMDRLDTMRFLIVELEANVNRANNIGYSAVNVAACEGNLAALQCLVKELGADVNHRDTEGYSSLATAPHEDNLDFVRCLVKELGVDVNRSLKNHTLDYCSSER
jgi:hypothetical protein